MAVTTPTPADPYLTGTDMDKGTCQVDECTSPAKYWNPQWCSSHYQRNRRHGDPLAGGTFVAPPGASCSLDGCTRPMLARTYCKMHYRSFMSYGDPLAARRKGQYFTDTHKLCSKCHEVKTLDEFSPAPRNASGRQSSCKPCTVAIQMASYHRRTPEQIDAYNRRTRKSRLLRLYGITVEEHDAILERQGGGCICGAVSPTRGRRVFSVDHDHSTGAVRGILCNRCNTALGLAGDDPKRLRLLADYLENAG